MQIPDQVWEAYGFNNAEFTVVRFGNGLINHTWKIQKDAIAYILQTINQQVFEDPQVIASNISLVANYLAEHHPEYVFVAPVKTKEGAEMVYVENNYFRIFPFVQGSHAKTVVQTADEAFEAAKQFGRFTRLLSGFETSLLKISLPKFHDISFRNQQFQTALLEGNQERIKSCDQLIHKILSFHTITERYQQIIHDPAFKIRATHHDTKISNVLFDEADKAICVIDLDTLMPGYFISDLGDMMRTYLSPVSEEEKDFTKIVIRKEFYDAIVEGYSSEMGEELSEHEKQAIHYAGEFMIYMQALRFITDYMNNDQYYGANYPEQNLVRAGNQLVLLELLIGMRLINK